MSTRAAMLHTVTKRLILMTATALAGVVAVFGLTLFWHQRFMISWVCFGCGLLGGFVSIQQRLKTLGDEELALLSRSWFQILLVPIYGGIFSLVLYVGLLSEIVKGPLFPQFAIPPFTEPLPTRDDVIRFLSQTYPTSGQDVAKLLFWSFVAGFSERFVPQLLARSEQGDKAGQKDPADKP
ncbi:MAG: hypothetical protein WAP57_01205 [Aquabacterium commune]|jgi:hypothetical protein|uniref:hypothetical protein n=1 Tax=Aquabacterium TaxID=92793 RepID=UPI001DDD5770|nr:hypothetical protein [Aquabacterium sp.]MBT9609980.1 hypothetical protein [Aquabacterium sp.]